MNKYRICSNVRQDKDHVELLTPKEFIKKQLKEIRRYQELKDDFSNHSAEQWITSFAKHLRDEFAPFTFANTSLKEKAEEEIARHRWIESEKHGEDLGIKAELDWFKKYVEDFNKYWKPRLGNGKKKN